MLLNEKGTEKSESFLKQQKIDLEKISDMQKLLDDNKDEKMSDDITGLQHKTEDEGAGNAITGKLIADENKSKKEKEENEEKLEKLKKLKIKEENEEKLEKLVKLNSKVEKEKKLEKLEKLKSKEMDSVNLKKVSKEEEKLAEPHSEENKIEEALMKELEANKVGKFTKEAEEKKLKAIEEGLEQVHTKTTHNEAIGDKVYNYLKNTDEFKKLMAEHMAILKEKKAPEIKMMKESNAAKENEETKTEASNKEDEKMAALENEKVNLEKEEKEKEDLKEESAESSKANDVKVELAHLKESEKTKAPEAENEGEKMSPAILKQLEELKEEKERLRLKEVKLQKIEEEIAKNKKAMSMNNFKNSTDEGDEDEVNHKIHLASPREPEQNVTHAISKFADLVDAKMEKHGSSNTEPLLDVPIEDTAVHEANSMKFNSHQSEDESAVKTVPIKIEETPALQNEENSANQAEVSTSSLGHKIHQAEESIHSIDEPHTSFAEEKSSQAEEVTSQQTGAKSVSSAAEESTTHQTEDKTSLEKVESSPETPHKLLSEKLTSSAAPSSTASGSEDDNNELRIVPHHTKKYISSIFSPETQTKMLDDKIDSKIEGSTNSEESKIITKHEVTTTKERKAVDDKLEGGSATEEVAEKDRHLTFGGKLGNRVETSSGSDSAAENKDTMFEGDLNKEVKSLTSTKLHAKDETDDFKKISKYSEGSHTVKPIASAVEKPVRGLKSLTFHIGNNDIHINSLFKTLDAKHIINKQISDGETRASVKSSGLDDNKVHISSKLKSLGSVVLKDLKMFQQVISQKNTDDVIAPGEANASKKGLTSAKECSADDSDELSHSSKHCEKIKSSSSKADKASFLPIHNPAPEEEFDDFLPTPKTKVIHLSPKNNIEQSSSTVSKKSGTSSLSHKQTEKAIARKLTPTTLAKELVSLESPLIPDDNTVKHHSELSKLLKLRAESMFGKHKGDIVQPEVNTEVQSASLTKHKRKDGVQPDLKEEEESVSLKKHKHGQNVVETEANTEVQTASLAQNKQGGVAQPEANIKSATASFVTPKQKDNIQPEANVEPQTASIVTPKQKEVVQPEANLEPQTASLTNNKNIEPIQPVANKEYQTASLVKPKDKDILQQEVSAEPATVSLTNYKQIDPIQPEANVESATASFLKPKQKDIFQPEANAEPETASLISNNHAGPIHQESNVEAPSASLIKTKHQDSTQTEVVNTEQQTAALLKPAINSIVSPTETLPETASLVKHYSPKLLDVTASKRHLPYKHRPSSILSARFPKTSLRQSIFKYLMAKKRAGTVFTPRDALILFPSNTANSRRRIEHHHFKFNTSTNDEPHLTPAEDSKLKPVNTAMNSTNIESKILIPGQSTASFSSSVDPGDITRSVLPKNNANTTLIEDVFNILGSEDQISYRSNVTRPNLDELKEIR